jgi:hypothetical protein
MKIKILYVFLVLIFVTAACSTQAFPAPDPNAAPTNTSAPTVVPTPLLLSPSLKLTSTPFEESKDGPVYKITAQIPTLTGSDDSRVAAFNTRMNEIVKKEVDAFRADIFANQPVVPFMAGSSFDVQYELIAQRGEVWSIKFAVMSFLDGAAHPNHYSITVNYDLAQGRELTLDELFLHGVNHMGTISDYCKAELSKRDIGFTDPIFQSGADPTPENYRNWNLSNDGLVITFDQYQVAPYAAGPQIVVIPFDKLTPLASDGSALKVFSQ